jgi:hypothetical protein
LDDQWGPPLLCGLDQSRDVLDIVSGISILSDHTPS